MLLPTGWGKMFISDKFLDTQANSAIQAKYSAIFENVYMKTIFWATESKASQKHIQAVGTFLKLLLIYFHVNGKLLFLKTFFTTVGLDFMNVLVLSQLTTLLCYFCGKVATYNSMPTHSKVNENIPLIINFNSSPWGRRLKHQFLSRIQSDFNMATVTAGL